MNPYSFLHPEPPDANIKPDLFRTQWLLKQLGIDLSSFRSILITGTNGKGTTAYWCWEILNHHGVQTGLYTSPHLLLPNERIRLPRGPVPIRDLIYMWNTITEISIRGMKTGVLDTMPTYFERMTACAFALFDRYGIRHLVLEVGLGGRWDATNVVDPLVSVLTSVGFDHTEYLGRSLIKIAREKYGVSRPGRPFITGVTQPRLKSLIRQWSLHDDVRCIFVDEIPIESGKPLFGHYTLPESLCSHQPKPRYLGFGGNHMLKNAIMAWLACKYFQMTTGMKWDPSVACEALTRYDWPARNEWIQMPDGRYFLLDGAHNVPAVRQLCSYLKQQTPEKFHLIFGVMHGKPWKTILRLLRPYIKSLYLIPVPATKRGWCHEKRQEAIKKFPSIEVPSYQVAVQTIMRGTHTTEPVLVTGSFYHIGMIRHYLMRRGGIRVFHPQINHMTS